MAWYSINYTCGHSDSQQLYGPEKERQSKIQWMERSQVCPECYRAEQDRVRAAETAKAKQENSDLPQLRGSAKQIEWAERVRAAAKRNLEMVVGEYNEEEQAKLAKLQNGVAVVPTSELIAFVARILKQAESGYWIDRRAEFASREATARYLSRRLREERAKAEGAKAIREAL